MSNSEEELQTVSKGGTIVSQRIPSAKTALSIYRKLREKDHSPAYYRSLIENLMNGNPPYSKAELRRRGLSWMSNVDWGEFRSSINLNTSSVWNMLVDVPVFVELNTDFKDSNNPTKDWGEVLAWAYSQVLREWDGFYFMTMFRIREMMKFGNGPVTWSDEEDWRSSTVRVANVLFPYTAKTDDVTKLDMFCIRSTIHPIDLYNKIRKENEAAANEMGWDVDYCRKVLTEWMKAGTEASDDAYAISNWESLEQMVQNQDDASLFEFNELRIVHLYSRERAESNPGEEDKESKITHQIIWEGAEDDSAQFMFEKKRRFLNMGQALHNFFFNIGDGLIKSVRGLGREIFATSHASNKLLNQMLTGVDMSAGLMLQTDSGTSPEQVHVVKRGPLMLVPNGVTPLQRQTMPSIQSIVGARLIMQNVANNNAGVYKNRDETLRGEPRTATEVQKESFNEARFESNQSVFYYIQWEAWHKETFRRLVREDYSSTAPGYDGHKRLRQLLKAKDFPMDLVDSSRWILTAKRSIGLGSIAQRMSITNQMVSMKPGLGEIGRRKVDKEWFAARVGWTNVQEFIPDIDENGLWLMIHSMAEGESVDMQNGSERKVAQDDPHAMHLTVHITKMQEIVQGFQESQSPEAAVQGMGLHLQHVMTHVEALDQDPSRKGQVKQYREILAQYAEAYKNMMGSVQKLQAARQAKREEDAKVIEEARQSLINREHDERMAKIAADKEVRMYEAGQLHEARMAKTITSIQAQMAELEAKIVAIRETAQADIDRQNASAESKLRDGER